MAAITQLLLWDLWQFLLLVASFLWHWANKVLARERNTKGIHVTLPRGELRFITLHLTPGAMCSLLAEDMWNYRNKKNCVEIEENQKWFRSLPVLQSRAQLQVVLLPGSVSAGSPAKGIKINIKVKNNCKVLELLHLGVAPYVQFSLLTIHLGPLMIVVRPAQSRATYRF